MSARSDLDELLQPSLEDGTHDEPPWRLSSQLYVAFFGGIFAITAIAGLNAWKLRLGRAQIAGIVALGVIGLVAIVISAGAVDTSSTARLLSRGISIVAYGGMYLIQRTADRVHAFHARDEETAYVSLVKPGIMASIPGALLLSAIVGGITNVNA
jgi:hypothetical protein